MSLVTCYLSLVTCHLSLVTNMSHKSDKPILVENLAKQASEAKSVTFIDYQGMGNWTLVDLRAKIRKAGGVMVVAKNTLIKLALDKTENIKQKAKELESELNGPTAVVFANEDEIAPLQVLAKSIKDTELPKLKFGIFSKAIILKEQLIALSKLPGKQVLQGQLVSSLLAPSYGLVGALQGNLNKLVFILDQRSKQDSISN